MRVIPRETESRLLGGPVLMLEDWDSAETLLQEERGIVEKHAPLY
jgi:hypothetical protein